MPRKPTIRTAEFPYHITARCINREWFRIPMKDVWGMFSDWLTFVRRGFDLRIHSFVLMTNHFHLLASTPKGNIDRCMNYFMREVSRSITMESNRINQTFGGPYHWSLIKSEIYYLNVYKYVYMNPIAAGLSDQCEDYQFSTLSGLLGHQPLTIPIEPDFMLRDLKTVTSTLEWINKSPERSTDFSDIRRGLKKSVFELRKERASGRLHKLEEKLL